MAHIASYPRDVLAVSAAVSTIAFSGVTDVQQEAWDLVEDLAPAYAGHWWYLSLLAFVRQDQARYDEAGALSEQVLALEPAAVLVGNGPGDPAQLDGPVETVRDLLGQVPLFGICLGHQLVALALGLRTFKLKFGHRGANHPVRVRGTSRVLVTAQNHGFAVEPSDETAVSHVSLNDDTVEGLEGDGFATLQFHPEASPGPLDALAFFDQIAETCRAAPTFARS
jgi:carbamoylphosphate synthase small subunit